MSESEHGYLVIQRGVVDDRPVEPGDVVDTYRLAGPLIWYAHEGTEQDMAEAHQAAAERGVAISAAAKRLTQVGRLPCDCRDENDPRRRTLATVVRDDRGELWVIPAPEKVPAAFRDDPHRAGRPPAFPLHGHGVGPHMEIVTCRSDAANSMRLAAGGSVHPFGMRAAAPTPVVRHASVPAAAFAGPVNVHVYDANNVLLGTMKGIVQKENATQARNVSIGVRR